MYMDQPPEGVGHNMLFAVEAETEADRLSAHSFDAETRRRLMKEVIKNFPEPVQNRITVLKNIQLSQLGIEGDFYKKLFELQSDYQKKYDLLYEQRSAIVNGSIEPPPQIPNWNSLDDVHYNLNDLEGNPRYESILKVISNLPNDLKGIPDFWLTIFKNVELIAQRIQVKDEPVLEKLVDLTIEYDNADYSFTLKFHFDKNDYFSNDVLTKKYFLKVSADEEDPFAFIGHEIYKCAGCDINWFKDKDLTQNNPISVYHSFGDALNKYQQPESFFCFFKPPVMSDFNEISREYDEAFEQLEEDFDIGNLLRTEILPKAVLFFTGDMIDSDEEDSDDSDDSENDEESPHNQCLQQ